MRKLSEKFGLVVCKGIPIDKTMDNAELCCQGTSYQVLVHVLARIASHCALVEVEM